MRDLIWLILLTVLCAVPARSDAFQKGHFASLGATSCSASACHGGPSVGVSEPTAVRGSEYPLWIESDPHARSWRTLNSQRSIDILKRLSILVDGQITDRAAYQNCLACHNTTASISADGISPTLPEGVGCESCHGPSESWRDSHYQGPASVRSAIEDRGMIETKSEIVRAKTCALCHVGGSDRDMNHDIIAAGHPALYFDYSVYLKAYPKHWREKPTGSSERNLERWLIGQLAKADAELELLQARITRTHTNSVWPEFSNFQCTSCHKTITEPRVPSPATATGKATVRMWNLEGLRVADQAFGFDPTQTEALLQTLAKNSNGPIGSASAQAELLGTIRNKKADLMSIRSADSPLGIDRSRLRWTAELQRNWARIRWESVKDFPDWETAALAYLATLPVDPNKREKQALDRLRQQLIFPESTQSPPFPASASIADPLDQLELNP